MFMAIFAIACLILFLVFTGFFIKRYFIDKRNITIGSQVVGENIFMQYQNEEKKRAIEQVIYQKEAEDEDDEGDDISRSPHPKNE